MPRSQGRSSSLAQCWGQFPASLRSLTPSSHKLRRVTGILGQVCFESRKFWGQSVLSRTKMACSVPYHPGTFLGVVFHHGSTALDM